jgi:hypothetical protein
MISSTAFGKPAAMRRRLFVMQELVEESMPKALRLTKMA